MKILAIETSCDETAAAVVEGEEKGWVKVLGEAVASSEEMHTKTGGVVPEVAAREQMTSMLPVVSQALEQAFGEKIESKNFREVVETKIDKIGVTVGPGLIGSLLVGVETAKTLAWVCNKPIVGVNHLRAHLYANFVDSNEKRGTGNKLPAVGLVVSGGHTELVVMKSLGEVEWVGGTRDDAAGECFDKCARILGLPYPGGPEIAALAERIEGRELRVEVGLPRPLIDSDDLDMSFSGLKVAVQRMVNNEQKTMSRKQKTENRGLVAEIAWELQEAVVEVLVSKLKLAVKRYSPNSVLVAGGVVANKRLREELESFGQELGVKIWVPELKYCTDNAVMVGAAAVFEPSPTPPEKLEVNPSLGIGE